MKIVRVLVVSIYAIASFHASASSNVIDLHSDDFGVLRHVGEVYLKQNTPFPIVSKTDFGLGYTSHGELPYPKTGFIGFDITGIDKNTDLLKLQLYKDENGWRIDRELDNSKIHQANPTHLYTSGHPRTDETSKAKIVAAKSLEKWLNDSSLMEDVRSTSMRCYLTKDQSKASCRGVYGIKTGDTQICQAKNYLLGNLSCQWQTVQEISDTQKVDYKTGELITYKPFSMHCG